MPAGAKKTTRGFTCRCPACGQEDTLRINVGDVHALTCGDCDAEWSACDLQEIIAGWDRLLAWLDAAPEK